MSIFPREAVNNSVVKLKEDRDRDGQYSAWFTDLEGGRTEYVITIACVVGRSRLAGRRVVTALPPAGPDQRPGGLVTNTGSHQLQLAWDPPRGSFTKAPVKYIQ